VSEVREVVSRLVARAPRTSTTVGAAALLVSMGALTGCSGFSGTGDLDYVQGEPQITQVEPKDREAPVEVSGDSVEEEPIDLADHRGEVVVVNVWGSWCPPCRAEMPMLVGAADELDPEQTEFVGINIRETSRDNAAAFEREYDVPYPSIYDPGSETLLRFGRYAPSQPPSTLVLDREGRVAALISGAVPSQRTLVDLVEDVAAEDGAEDGAEPADG
jgi:thiol-disulfide isomerase/thioredoxin